MQNKTAKEMFEEQGLDLVMDNEIATVYADTDGMGILFRKVFKSYNINIPEGLIDAYLEGEITISMEIHKAIHQKLRELGWLNE